MELEVDKPDLDFQVGQDQKPPDLNQIIEILKNLAVQVQNIQTSQITKKVI